MTRRTISHPGPVAARRHAAVACRAVPLTLTLEPGRSINAAIAEAFASQGFEGGFVDLVDVPMSRMDYVIPAASPDGKHAAWYSDTRSPEKGGTIRSASVHMGQRDGEPFFHCHGQWEVPGEGLKMGHLLPFDAEVARTVKVSAIGLSGALLDVTDDAETNFRLFAPSPRTPVAAGEKGGKAVLATVRPNEDICEQIEAICSEHDIDTARVVGLREPHRRRLPGWIACVLIRHRGDDPGRSCPHRRQGATGATRHRAGRNGRRDFPRAFWSMARTRSA